MVRFTTMNLGDRVKCIYMRSAFYGRVGKVVGYECDGWIRIAFDGDSMTRVCHPNDLEIVKEETNG